MDKILSLPRLAGGVRAPSSKSEAHRHLIVAALSHLYGAGNGVRRVRCTDLNEDIEATARCLSALGADISREGEDFLITPITAIPRSSLLDCGESGSTLRFLLPVVCALGGLSDAPAGYSVSLIGHGRLPERPLSPLYEELVAHGAVISRPGGNPLVISGGLTAGDYAIDGGVSSQFVSGLLFALPLLRGDSRLEVTGRIESAPYIEMTLDAVRSVTEAVGGELPLFTVTGREHALQPKQATDAGMTVGGDWSGAAFFLTAGVLTPEGHSVTVSGLDLATRQGDAAITDILRRMGGRIDMNGDGSLTAYASHLHGCEIDAAQIPDLVPILAVAAAVAEGETRITGAARLRIKESDRLATVTAMLTNLGADIRETADGLIIRGVPFLHGGCIDAAGDHRIAMSAAVAATRVARVCGGSYNTSVASAVTVKGAEAVAKSYPSFWEVYEGLLVEGTMK